MVRAAVHGDERGESRDQAEHDQGAAAGASGDAAGSLALLVRDQVYGLHRGASSTASPAATARRSAETEPAEPSSSRPTVCGVMGTRSSFCSARAKPEICSAGPLSTMLDTSPPPSWERWKSN